MFFFKEKKRVLYPSVYSEWIKEFKKMDTILIREEELILFQNGGLIDYRCIDNFKRELTVFLEKQINCYFKEVSKLVQQYVEENDYEYLILMIRRYHLRYQYLYFFLGFEFLDNKFKEQLRNTLNDKLNRYDNELIIYCDKIAEVSVSMGEVSINIKRLIDD